MAIFPFERLELADGGRPSWLLATLNGELAALRWQASLGLQTILRMVGSQACLPVPACLARLGNQLIDFQAERRQARKAILPRQANHSIGKANGKVGCLASGPGQSKFSFRLACQSIGNLVGQLRLARKGLASQSFPLRAAIDLPSLHP